MRVATIQVREREQAAIQVDGHWAPLDLIDPAYRGDLLTLIETSPSQSVLEDLQQAAQEIPSEKLVAESAAKFSAPFRHPRMVWGIGLNYAAHAGDLSAELPRQPASFIKGSQTIIGPCETIRVPRQSSRTTAEAELGIVIGKLAENVPLEQAMDYVFGLCLILDQTAEDILQENPRYLTRAKNFPTFFSFGPEILTTSEPALASLAELEVSTVVNNTVIRKNSVKNMIHGLAELIAFHTAMMPLYPGDVISSGTPGAGVIVSGDTAEARCPGFKTLTNPVA
jgi:2-keto-4-pentenoate hydratase/2-oxohepta-3-ene-1,7-dioic acid hydratase in catechol pathway